jgi:hypothetical protein
MATSCKQEQERVEQQVLQPIDTWAQQLEQRCRNEPCIWWMLCLNKVFCWLAVVVVKIVLWVLIVVVRWVYRTVCVAVTLVVGVLALLIGRTDILVQAVSDLWDLTKDGFYAATGLVIFVALRIVDLVQSAFGAQPAKRPLTKEERAVLRPVFRESLNYNAIEVVDGPAGVLGISGRAFTMAYTIYLPAYSVQTLVHECVHVWQFQFEGFRYIGNSAFNQLDALVFSRGYQPYAWQSRLDAGDSWYTLKSAEAQASFVDEVWATGIFDHSDASTPDAVGSGAFFREDAEAGVNRFQFDGNDYTAQANAAWRLLRTG